NRLDGATERRHVEIYITSTGYFWKELFPDDRKESRCISCFSLPFRSRCGLSSTERLAVYDCPFPLFSNEETKPPMPTICQTPSKEPALQGDAPLENAPLVVTFGCRLNTYESQVMKDLAHQAGLTKSIIIN